MMKRYLLTLTLALALAPAYAQDSLAFDFWIGEWDLTWTNADGEEVHGTNVITKVLDGRVIEENFHDPNTGFKGKSLSVYNSPTGKWHQAWADNQGSYYDFIGDQEGDIRIFKTRPIVRDGKVIIQRMRFCEITQNSMVWDWERTDNGGKDWSLVWRIHYKRRGSW